MGYCIIQKARIRQHGNRLRWGMVLAQSGGHSLVLTTKSKEDGAHVLTICSEGVDGVFEPVNASCFVFEDDDSVAEAGRKLEALSEHLGRDRFERFLEDL